jgi:ABC-type phosphate transport system substrate-binding protein
MRPRTCVSWLVVVFLIALGGTRSLAEDVKLKVIVHPDNPIVSVSRGFLRDAFLKKSTEWDGGEAIFPVDLSWRFAERRVFTEQVLQKTPAQVKAYWNQQIFSGKGVPPPEADSPRAVIAYVLANPGAVGYIPATTDPAGAKVVGVQ